MPARHEYKIFMAPREQPYMHIGYMLICIAQACGITCVPPEYAAAVVRLRRMRRISSVYQRPGVSSNNDVSELHRCGRYTKVHPLDRLVAEELDPWRHLNEALKLRFPRKHGAGKIGNCMREAANELARCEWHRLDATRRLWITEFQDALRPLGPMNDHIRSFAPSNLAPIMQHLNVASIAAIAEAVWWPDELLCRHLLFGAPVVDGPEESCPDTKLFRPIGANASYTLDELHSGDACPRWYQWSNGKREEVRGERLPSSERYFAKCAHDTKEEAVKALAKAGITHAQARSAMMAHAQGNAKAVPTLLARVADAKARRGLRRVFAAETISRKEADATKPTAEQPQPWRAFEERANTTMGGIRKVRVARRHVVYRGVDKNGDDKPRAVDDCRHANGAATVPEAVDYPSFMCIVWMACWLMRACWSAKRKRPQLFCGLDDMASAYRVVSAAWRPCVGYVVWYSLLAGCMVVQRFFGHLFGQKAASNNYSRVPRLACVVAITFFLVLVWHYVDDHMYCDLAWGHDTAMLCLDCVYAEMGWELEPGKRKPMGEINVALGAQTDLSRSTEGVAIVRPDMAKVKENLDALRLMKERGECRPADAEQVVGRWRWSSSQVFSRVGTAALQPFAERARSSDRESGRQDACKWTEAMSSSLEFLELVFSDEFRHELVIPMLAQLDASGAPITDDEPCLICYTDAETKPGEPTGAARTSVHGWCAYHVVDQRDGRHYSGRIAVDDTFQARLKQGRATYIGQYEEIAAVAVMYTLPQLFKDRKVIHFVDNAGSLSHLVNGYAGEPDSAKIVNMFHIALLALGVEWWGEWVPSKANPADLKTRVERLDEFYAAMAGVDLTEDDMILPDIDMDASALREWMLLMRNRIAEQGERAD